MYDNTNNLTATFDGCSIKTVDIENLGPHTFVSSDSETSRIVIESSDIGGIDSFIGDDNKYFIIKYMGRMPKITYQYHFNETELDTIFEIDPSGTNFGKLVFAPSDDVSAGVAETALSLATLDGYARNELYGLDNSVISSAFAIHSYVGESAEKGHEEESYIGIAAHSRGMRIPILKVLGSGLILGSVSKRIILTLSNTTKVESFSIGTLKMFDATKSNEELLAERASVFDIMEDQAYEDYIQSIKKFQKMIDHPNKIFNTDSEI